MRQLKLFSMSFACLIAALGSLAILSQELDILLQPQRTEPSFFNQIASRPPPYGPSSYSKKITLIDCTYALLNLHRVETPEKAAAVARSCERLSDSMTATMPTNAHAWYVKALAHARLGETDAFLASYRKSRELGPNEQWLAENRTRLAEEMYAELDEESRSLHQADLTLLANSPRGTRTLAARYATNEEFRERIIQIVERLPPDRQRAFLQNVRSVLR